MPTAFTRIVLFLSSYSPLLVIFAFHLVEKHPTTGKGLIVAAAISLIGLGVFLRVVNGLSPSSIVVTSVKSRDGDVMSYIVTYLLPFLAIKLDDVLDDMSFGLLLGVVAVLYVNSNLIYVNPVLNLCGYHIFEIEDQHEKTSILISRRRYLRVQDSVRAVSVGDYVLVEKR